MVSRYYRRSYHFYSVHAAACLSSNINNMAYTCTVVHLPIFKRHLFCAVLILSLHFISRCCIFIVAQVAQYASVDAYYSLLVIII